MHLENGASRNGNASRSATRNGAQCFHSNDSRACLDGAEVSASG